MDLYEDQSKNYDMSGGHEQGKLSSKQGGGRKLHQCRVCHLLVISKRIAFPLAEFKNHSAALGYTEGRVNIISGDSTKLTVHDFSKRGFPAFRIFSVDGGENSGLFSCLMWLAD